LFGAEKHGRKRTEISSPDREEVERLLRATTNPREKERLIVARMAMSGKHTLAMMAEVVGRARSSIQIWLDKFETGGVAGLLDRKRPPGRDASLSAQVQQEVKAQLAEGTWRTAQEFRHWLEQTHQINLSLAGCYYWLGKSGGVLKAPRPSHAKQVPGAVDEFKMAGWERQYRTPFSATL
jgi:transposase